jgi:hypothetical protein
MAIEISVLQVSKFRLHHFKERNAKIMALQGNDSRKWENEMMKIRTKGRNPDGEVFRCW